MLLFKLLNDQTSTEVINAAVQGFGVDQMILKLEEILPTYRPDLVIFAYIPRDLWRAGRNINYGFTKPVLVVNGSGTWRITPTRLCASTIETS